MAFKKDGYTLYELSRNNRDMYFFSKGKPKAGHQCDLPSGKEVGVNKKTGLPFLRNK